MAKGFVTHALSQEVIGLEDVISWLYLSKENKGPRLLLRIVEESRALLEDDASRRTDANSSNNGNKTTVRIGGRMHLSSGAKMLLRKHLMNLEKHLHRKA